MLSCYFVDAPIDPLPDSFANIFCSYAIDVQQDYENGSPTGTAGNSVTISGVTFEDISGTVSGSSAYNYYVLCGSGSCTDFTWTSISVTGGTSSCSPSGSICPS